MLILASKSQSRRAMLDAAGVAHESLPADVDERSIELAMGERHATEVAIGLACAKALAVSRGTSNRLVLGGDSLVTVGGRRFDKPASRDEAAEHLRFFSGKVMELHSAAALSRGDAVLWSHADVATLHVRPLSESFIESYIGAEWPEISHCAGAFRIEALGAQLFSAIEGDQFTVMGMPLLAVLGALREFGELEA